MRLPNNSAGIARTIPARWLKPVRVDPGVFPSGSSIAHAKTGKTPHRSGSNRAQLPFASPGAGPVPWGIDCGCWEDPASGRCVEFSCTCDDPFSCFALKVGCAITGGDWGGWDDDECTWSSIRQSLPFKAI